MKVIMCLVLLIASSGLRAGKVVEFKPTEKTDSFVEQMQQSSDPAVRDVVLESYINSLLKAHAIGLQEGRNTVSYSVRSYREGQLVVTREEQKAEKN